MQMRALLLGLFLPGLAHAGGVDVLSFEAASQRWQPIGALAVPSAPPGAGSDACVNLGFLVDSNGATSAFAVLRAWSSDTVAGENDDPQLDLYARHAAAAVQTWRFRAAAGNTKRRPVYTQATFVFRAQRGADAALLRARCEVGDLRTHVEQAYGRKFRRGDLGKGQLDRNRQQYPWQIPEGCARHAGWCD